MSAQCGLFMQKVLNAQSQSFNKSLATSMPTTAKTNIHEPYTNLATQETVVNGTNLQFDNEQIELMEHETSSANRSDEDTARKNKLLIVTHMTNTLHANS